MAQPSSSSTLKATAQEKAQVLSDITHFSTWHCHGIYYMHRCGHLAIQLLSLAFGKLQLYLMLYVIDIIYILQLSSFLFTCQHQYQVYQLTTDFVLWGY